MEFVAVQIVRFVDQRQPGWAECEFVDAEGRQHIVVDKIPIFTGGDLVAASKYPIGGWMPCEVLGRYKGTNEQELALVTTAKPCGVESKDCLNKFTVHARDISSDPKQ